MMENQTRLKRTACSPDVKRRVSTVAAVIDLSHGLVCPAHSQRCLHVSDSHPAYTHVCRRTTSFNSFFFEL